MRMWLRWLSLGLYFVFAVASAEPGSREGINPWFGYGSVPNKIIDIQARISETRSERDRVLRYVEQEYQNNIFSLREKEAEASRIGMPFLTDSKDDYREEIREVQKERNEAVNDIRTDYQKELEELNQEITNALASPVGETAKERQARVRAGTASREALEVHNAMLNLQKSILELNTRLSSDRSNYDLAATTYRAQQQLCRYVIQMNQELRQRIEQTYKPQFRVLLTRIEDAASRTQASTIPASLKQQEEQNLVQLRRALEQGLPMLNGHKEWAAQNMEVVRRQLEIYTTMHQNVEIMKDASAIVADVNADIAKVEFTAPELIEYELEGADFELR